MSRDHPRQASTELVELAAVTRAHGLRGEVQLKLFNVESELLLELGEVVLKAPDGSSSLRTLDYARRHGQSMIAKLTEVSDRNAAEALRGSVVCVDRALLPEPEEGEYYFVDLIGLRAEEEGAGSVGEVLDVIEYPSVECLVIDREGARWEVPMLDRYLVEVDLEGGRVVLQNLAELADLQPKPRGRT